MQNSLCPAGTLISREGLEEEHLLKFLRTQSHRVLLKVILHLLIFFGEERRENKKKKKKVRLLAY